MGGMRCEKLYIRRFRLKASKDTFDGGQVQPNGVQRRAEPPCVLAGAETLVPASGNGSSQKEAPVAEENGLLGRRRAPDSPPLARSRGALEKGGVNLI